MKGRSGVGDRIRGLSVPGSQRETPKHRVEVLRNPKDRGVVLTSNDLQSTDSLDPGLNDPVI